MSIVCGELINYLEKIAPSNLAEDWDNVGLLVGRYEKIINKVLITLDVTSEVIEQAITEGFDIIISHHPFIFNGIKSITTDTYFGRNIYKLIQNDVCIYSMHTNMDVAKCGLAEKLADIIGLKHISILEETKDYNGNIYGIGRVGEFSKPISFFEFVDILKKALNCDTIRYTGNKNKQIKKVAICPGSGMEYFKKAYNKNVDLYITGDLKYHQALEVNEMDFLVIDAEHFFTERIFEQIIEDNLKGFAEHHKFELHRSIYQKSPLKYM